MKSKLVASVFALVMSLSGPGRDAASGPAEDSQSPTNTRVTPPVSVDPGRIMALICRGRPDSALALLETRPESLENDPFALLLKSRAMREALSDEDDDKSRITSDSEDIHRALDRAIALCDRALEEPTADPVFLYYRGRAWLAKAQLYTLARSYWSAGRSASKSKGDLEEFLKRVPRHADASGDLGAFLYFADTLPGVVKFVSRILFIPTGDRDRGLDLLAHAAGERNGAVFQVDYQIALAAILLVFEGRFEEGTGAMRKLIDKYPYYTRLVEPYGVLAPLYPLGIRDFEALEDDVIARHLSDRSDSPDSSLVGRIALHRAYLRMLFLSPQRALRELSALIDDPPARPDWVAPLAMVQRSQLLAKSGRIDEAKKDLEAVLSSAEASHFHNLARKLLESLKEVPKAVVLDDLEFISAIYDGDLPAAYDGLSDYRSRYGESVLYHFYRGEAKLFEQEFDGAAEEFNKALALEVHAVDETYQMFALLRLAELDGRKGNYDSAKKRIEKSLEYTHAGYLFDMLVAARKRYYELLSEGKVKTPPTMLIAQPLQSAKPAATPGK